MNDITNKEVTQVEFTEAEFNALVEKRARAIVKERDRAPQRRLGSLAGNPRILNSLRDKEGNFREPAKKELRKMFELERTHEILSRIRKKDGGYHKPTKEELEFFFGLENIKKSAGYIVELHMDTKRSEAVIGAYKKYLMRSEPIMGEILVQEIDRAIAGYNAKPTE